MKRLIILSMAILLATSASAIVDPSPNTLGVYMDTTADEFCAPGLVEPLTEFTVYMILTNPNFSGLSGLEVGYRFDGVAEVDMIEFSGPGASDSGSPGNHEISYDSPLMLAEINILATMTVTNYDFEYGPATLIIEGLSFPVPDFDIPVAILEDGTRVGLNRTFPDGATFRMNADCEPVANESLSFGSVKSLYR